MRYLYGLIAIIFGLLVGCSSEKATKPISHLTPSVKSDAVQFAASDSPIRDQNESAVCDTFAVDSSYNELTAQLLERARQHYLTALSAQEQKDSTQSANEFEYAISILNELSYYPNIDSNRDFNDLSHSVIEDYEKYISSIDSLGDKSSVFALRQKLNQIDESNESPDQDAPKAVITTMSVPLVINGHVEKNIKFFQERGRGHFESWLYRSGKYFPIMKKAFREEGVPQELASLSMIESGLNPVARSWARAVGLWQFMRGTGQLYGLKGNLWYDERRDFEKASKAAAKHLKDLNAEFGDWYLALAAYNSGAGRVSSAIRRSKSTDFWKMRRFLPRETRNYVPQYIAATVMTLDPKAYGFDIAPAESLKFEYVKVNDCVDLTVLAKCAGTSVDTLQDLNPELLQWCTPPGYEGYTLRVPRGSKERFEEQYAQIPDDQKRDWTVYKVRKRETLASIAKKYGLTVALIQEANHFSPGQRLSIGKEIVLPVPSSAKLYAAKFVDDSERKRSSRSHHSAKAKTQTTRGKERLTYQIKKGDTIGKIAAAYNVRVSDLRIWNDIPYGSTIRSGNTLEIWQPKETAGKSPGAVQKTIVAVKESVRVTQPQSIAAARKDSIKNAKALSYKVKKGDTLHSIASTFGVSIKVLRVKNNIRGSKIHVGQELIINS